MPDVLLRCEAVHKSYMLGRTVLPVLRGVNMAIERGRLVAVVGSSGSGKSTLLHVMSGLDVPQRGQVYYEGRPVFEPEEVRIVPLGRDADGSMLRAGAAEGARRPLAPSRTLEKWRNELLNAAFGFVFQFYHLLPEFDVLENVMLPLMVGRSVDDWLAQRRRNEERALALLDRMGLSGRLRHRPNELSGGERQRVAIARALVNNPAVLFADEPTGNLDARTGRDIFSLLTDLNRGGQTIVLVTHDHDLAAQADVVVRLVDGRIQ